MHVASECTAPRVERPPPPRPRGDNSSSSGEQANVADEAENTTATVAHFLEQFRHLSSQLPKNEDGTYGNFEAFMMVEDMDKSADDSTPPVRWVTATTSSSSCSRMSR